MSEGLLLLQGYPTVVGASLSVPRYLRNVPGTILWGIELQFLNNGLIWSSKNPIGACDLTERGNQGSGY